MATMKPSQAIMKLTKLLTEAYAEAVGPKKAKKGKKKVKTKDHPRLFDALARHLTAIRLATMIGTSGDPPAPTGGDPPGSPDPAKGCPVGTIWCVLPAPLTSQCMTPDDCTASGGRPLKPQQ